MKLLFSLLFGTLSLSLSAQVLGPDIDKQIKESIRKRVEEDKAKKMGPSFPLFKTDFPPKGEEGNATGRKAGVYALPQDGMPCIVPDTNGIAAIPNAAPFIFPYRQDMPTRPGKKKDTK